MEDLRTHKATIDVVFDIDLSQPEEVHALMEGLGANAELYGIFNVAAVTDDALFETMDANSWETPLKAKIAITRNICLVLDDARWQISLRTCSTWSASAL